PRGSMLPRFGLFPVRSPLLGESRLISVPPGTEMFQVPGLAPHAYAWVTDLAIGRVSPFGHPGITARLQLPQAYRSLPRPSSPLDAKGSTLCLIAFALKFDCVLVPRVGERRPVLIPHTRLACASHHPSFSCQRAGRPPQGPTKHSDMSKRARSAGDFRDSFRAFRR